MTPKLVLYLLIAAFSINSGLYAQCWKSIQIGQNGTAAIRHDGSLWNCGWNYYGQLGDGTTEPRNYFAQLGTDNDWEEISLTEYGAIARKNDGTIWGWGYTTYGNTTPPGEILLTPQQIGTDIWTSVSTYIHHTMGLKPDGSLWTWGGNMSGQLGTGNLVDQTAPVQVGSGTDWVKIAAGADHSVALKSNGTLWAWGSNLAGEVGQGTYVEYYTIPKQVGTWTDWTAIAAGADCTFGIRSDGSLWAWGSGASGKLGAGDYFSKRAPVQIGIGKVWVKVRSRAANTMAIASDGTLWIWGSNAYGQFGNGATSPSSTVPVQVGDGTNWESFASGSYVFGLTDEGVLFGWGVNTSGQLGIGNNDETLSPTEVDCVYLDVDDTVSENRLMWPNPVRDILFVHNDVADVTIYDISGKRLLNRHGPEYPVDLSGMLPGVYVVEMRKPDGTVYVQKLVKL